MKIKFGYVVIFPTESSSEEDTLYKTTFASL